MERIYIESEISLCVEAAWGGGAQRPLLSRSVAPPSLSAEWPRPAGELSAVGTWGAARVRALRGRAGASGASRAEGRYYDRYIPIDNITHYRKPRLRRRASAARRAPRAARRHARAAHGPRPPRPAPSGAVASRALPPKYNILLRRGM
ncbi:hypothetical protein EVAR_53272_1 [Eumeta japonica]|uniref:Uncharacterized protein n=1 Tax=Eumeta variegata TaxID=151549 RepID=A0A4C1YK76_EUMVA|nr:hypothetical protein EVAR_53272_1 [Eumeta japonica]